LIKSLENKHLNPRILDHFLPTNWEKNPLLERGKHCLSVRKNLFGDTLMKSVTKFCG